MANNNYCSEFSSSDVDDEEYFYQDSTTTVFPYLFQVVMCFTTESQTKKKQISKFSPSSNTYWKLLKLFFLVYKVLTASIPTEILKKNFTE